MRGTAAFPCGQCMPCRFNRRRLWTHRIMLESLCHSDSAFVTLTYAEDHLPAGRSLQPKDLQNWLKRLRKRVAPLSLRFYAVGEYSDDNRPHYHAVLFGYPTCRFGNTRVRYHFGGGAYSYPCCSQCDLVHETWGFGNVFLGDVTTASAQYCAGYVTKKMTRTDDPRLEGRWPEFARMSNRPGIGLAFMHDVASDLMRLGLDTSQPDVPSALRHGSRVLPLGRYLRQKLRTLIGKDAKAPQETLDEMAKQVLVLYQTAAENNSLSTFLPKEALMEVSSGKVARLEALNRIYRKKESI